MKREVRLIVSVFLTIFLLVITIPASALSPVDLQLSPGSDTIPVNQPFDIEIKINPNGYNLTSLEIRLDVSGASNYYTVGTFSRSMQIAFPNLAGSLGSGSIFSITADLGGSGNVPPVTGTSLVSLGTVRFTPKSGQIISASFTMPVTVFHVTSREVPTNWTPVVSPLPAGSFTIGQAITPTPTLTLTSTPTPTVTPLPTGTPIPTPTLTPTPTPNPQSPNIISPASGADFIIDQSNPSSNKPEFRWTMMGNPVGGRIKREGVRIVKISDNPDDSTTSLNMGCSEKVIVDRWWFNSNDQQSHNPTQPDSPTNLRICGDGDLGGLSYPKSSAAAQADIQATARGNLAQIQNDAYTPTKGFSPGKYLVSVWNFDNTYRCDGDCTGSDSAAHTASGSSFSTAHYFTVHCPAGKFWDGSSCGLPTTLSYAMAENPGDLDRNKIKWENYTAFPMTINYRFSSVKVGDVRTLYVRFKNNRQEVFPPFEQVPFGQQIQFIGADPTIDTQGGISCDTDATQTGTNITIRGGNLGSALGRVTVGADEAIIQPGSWVSEEPSPTPLATITGNATVSPTGPSSTPVPTGGQITITSAPTGLPVYTAFMRIAEAPPGTSRSWDFPRDLLSHPDGYKEYAYSGHDTKVDYPLVQPLNSGDIRTIFVQFYTPSGNVLSRASSIIQYLPPPTATLSPTVTSTPTPTLTPTLTPTVTSSPTITPIPSATLVPTLTLIPTITATPTGAVTPTATPTRTPTVTLVPTNTPTPSPTPRLGAYGGAVLGLSNASGRIVAHIDKLLAPDTQVPVTVTTADGRATRSSCIVNTTTATFTLKSQCQKDNVALSNVDIKLYEDAPGANPLVFKVTTDSTGQPQGFAPRLQVGHKYALVIKAPKDISQVIKFKAEKGMNDLGEVTLPTGDITGRGNSPDNTIDTFDVSALFRDWVLTLSAGDRAGDLNGDGRVNSLDYSCMISNFRRSGDTYTPPSGNSI